MSEAEKDPVSNVGLPEFRGMAEEVAHVQKQLRVYSEARGSQHELSFRAELPQIIGYVPLEERKFFTSFVPETGLPTTGVMLSPTDEAFQAFINGMPTVFDQIMTDIAQIGKNDLVLDSVVLDRKETEAGSLPRPVRQWHIDPDLCYLITDQQPTEFYHGPARLTTGAVMLDVSSIDPTIESVVSSPFAIVRQTPLTVHRSPVFNRKANRTFVDFLTSRK